MLREKGESTSPQHASTKVLAFNRGAGAAGENDASVKLTEESAWKIGLAQHRAGPGQAFIAEEA